MALPNSSNQPEESLPGQQSIGPEKFQITPELREWAIRQFTEEEILAGLLELRNQGGQELHEFVDELEQIVVHP